MLIQHPLHIFIHFSYFTKVFKFWYFFSVEEEAADDKASDKDANKKKVWLEKESTRWQHDRFNDQEQAPKSRSELVSIYGYDIRNEDGPPRARRRRRYG